MTDTQQVQYTVPETINYTDADLDNLNKRKAVKEGWMKLVVSNYVKKISKKGNFWLELLCNPVSAEGEICSTTVPFSLFIPVVNPDVPGHTAPNTKRGIYFFGRAIDKDFPRYTLKKSPGNYTDFEGNAVDLAQKKAIDREVDKTILSTAISWWNDPDQLKDEAFFGYVEHSLGTDGSVWPRVEKVRMDTPDGDIILDDFTETV